GDYVCVRLLDEGTLFDAMRKVQAVYPNALKIDRVREPAGAGSSDLSGSSVRCAREELDELRLFERFFLETTGAELSEDEAVVVSQALASAAGLAPTLDAQNDDGTEEAA